MKNDLRDGDAPPSPRKSGSGSVEVTRQWVAPGWHGHLAQAGLLDTRDLALREFDWFEPPNKRRGGWSGVSRIPLDPKTAPAGESEAIFLKIQQNHFYRAPNTWFRKRLTFEREFNVMQRMESIAGCFAPPVFFSTWKEGGNRGALLMVQSLDGWLPLNHWLRGENGLTPPDQTTLLHALQAIARIARRIHDAGWVHLAFSPKHLFLKPERNGEFQARVVDLEKARQHLLPGYRTIKDTSHFLKRTPGLSEDLIRQYLFAYFQTHSFTPRQQRWIRKMHGAPKP